MNCFACLDAGVVEAYQDNFKTLALCFCRQGFKQGWNLERIPLKEFSHRPLDWREYKSKIGTGDYLEKIEWHKQRIRNAESFWASERAKGAE